MARPRMDSGMSIAKLESFLRASREKLSGLQKERDKAAKALAAIDAKIAAISGGAVAAGGGAVRAPGTRARNAKSLTTVLGEVLSSGKPMSVGDIVDGVLATGYQSSSPNFRGIVNQTLIKEKKTFGSAGRGMYQLKK